jgi:hypothetical protein
MQRRLGTMGRITTLQSPTLSAVLVLLATASCAQPPRRDVTARCKADAECGAAPSLTHECVAVPSAPGAAKVHQPTCQNTHTHIRVHTHTQLYVPFAGQEAISAHPPTPITVATRHCRARTVLLAAEGAHTPVITDSFIMWPASERHAVPDTRIDHPFTDQHCAACSLVE